MIDPSREERAQAARSKLLARFEALSDHDKGGYVLHQPLRLHHLKVPFEAKPARTSAMYG